MKRFLIIVLALAMLLPNFSVVGIAADENVQNDCQNELDFLGMFDVVDDIITQDGIITKAEFTHMIVKSMNMTTSAFTTSPFSDVYASTSYASSVVKAYDAGIVSGSGTGLFNPDEPINGYAAVKMAISALGYNDIAMAYGGYPTGYYKIAKEVGLLSGISVFKSSPLTTYEVINFIYNFLTADIYMVSAEFRYTVGEWRIGEPKSKSGYRTIPLTEMALEILKDQKEKMKKLKIINLEFKDYVFLSRKGEPTKNSAYDTTLFKLCDKAGIERFSMHVLRHTFATRLCEADVNIKVIQDTLGHKDISTTMEIYAEATKNYKQKELGKMEVNDDLWAI